MRCPNCNKFTALEFQEPELESFDGKAELDSASGDLKVTASMRVRIARNTECCSDEAKTADLEADADVVIDRAEIEEFVEQNDEGEWQWRDGVEAKVDNDEPEQVEEGGGRYAKSFFGASVHWSVVVGEKVVHEDDLVDKVAASAMDESMSEDAFDPNTSEENALIAEIKQCSTVEHVLRLAGLRGDHVLLPPHPTKGRHGSHCARFGYCPVADEIDAALMRIELHGISTMTALQLLDYIVNGDGAAVLFEGHDGWPEYVAIVNRFTQLKEQP